MIHFKIRFSLWLLLAMLLIACHNNDVEKIHALPTSFVFQAARNSMLLQDIVFEKVSDKQFVATVSPGVELRNLIPTFQYDGEVRMNGAIVLSEVTRLDLSDYFKVYFDDRPAMFLVNRRALIPTVRLTTENGQPITSTNDYINCSITIDGKNIFEDFTSTTAEIRGRGNSTWKYYDKKPYRLKLSSEAAILGMKPAKSWVFLANYRDPTYFMNAVVFDMARYLEMPFTNSNRFAEVYLNDEYIGMYQITEQIQQGKNRVNINKETGVLLSLDLDDGPGYSPDADDNFYSSVYHLPVAVKHPENLSASQMNNIKEDFAILESLIDEGDMNTVSQKLDVQSLIDFLIIQELTRNVELVSPRSMYMYKDGSGIYHFGPVWDFDGGFSFDWASMETGHNYFSSQSWLMGSTNPATHPHSAYNYISGFFVNLFSDEVFVEAYQERWSAVHADMLEYCFTKLDDYALQCEEAMTNNSARWPIGKDYKTEIGKLKSWLSTRAANYTQVVNNY